MSTSYGPLWSDARVLIHGYKTARVNAPFNGEVVYTTKTGFLDHEGILAKLGSEK